MEMLRVSQIVLPLDHGNKITEGLQIRKFTIFCFYKHIQVFAIIFTV